VRFALLRAWGCAARWRVARPSTRRTRFPKAQVVPRIFFCRAPEACWVSENSAEVSLVDLGLFGTRANR
jgi:hypothetical protein